MKLKSPTKRTAGYCSRPPPPFLFLITARHWPRLGKPDGERLGFGASRREGGRKGGRERERERERERGENEKDGARIERE